MFSYLVDGLDQNFYVKMGVDTLGHGHGAGVSDNLFDAARSDVERFSKLKKYTSFEELDSFMLHELIEKITIYETPNMGRYRKSEDTEPPP